MEVAVLENGPDSSPSSVVLTRNRLLPGAIGLDIGCGLTLAQLDVQSWTPEQLHEFSEALSPRITGRKGAITFSREDFPGILRNGGCWLYKAGFVHEDELNRLEFPQLPTDLTPNELPEMARKGLPQLGSLGRGGHFLALVQIQCEDDALAKRLGLIQGGLALLIHSGSRDFGRHLAEHHLAAFARDAQASHSALASATGDSALGQAFLKAHNAAVNSAVVNRMIMLFLARQAAARIWGCRSWMIYDHCHNLVSSEVIDGLPYLVHRKGAARCYPSGHHVLADSLWEEIGHPVMTLGDSIATMVGEADIAASFFSLGSPRPGLARGVAHLNPILTLKGLE